MVAKCGEVALSGGVAGIASRALISDCGATLSLGLMSRTATSIGSWSSPSSWPSWSCTCGAENVTVPHQAAAAEAASAVVVLWWYGGGVDGGDDGGGGGGGDGGGGGGGGGGSVGGWWQGVPVARGEVGAVVVAAVALVALVVVPMAGA